MSSVSVIGLAIAFCVAIWVAADASARGKSTGAVIFWFLGTWLAMLIFLPMWLTTRPKFLRGNVAPSANTPVLCLECGKHYLGTSVNCSHCGTLQESQN